MSVVLIFSGYNPRAVIAFCRFAYQNNIKIAIVAKNDSDPILRTLYQKDVILIRDTNQFSITDFVVYNNIISKTENVSKILILPSTEHLNRFLLDNREVLESIGYDIPLCQLAIYKSISDKFSFGEICRSNGITIPNQYDALENFTVPIVAKPITYLNKKGNALKPYIILNKNDYEKFTRNFDHSDFYYQDFVGGNSYYFLYYIDLNGTSSVFFQENLIQQFNGGSIIAAKSIKFSDIIISEKFSTLFARLEFRGMVMVEVKYYQNKYFMIEANPRLWGPSQLIIDSGMDLFHKFALDYNLIDSFVPPKYNINTFYFWAGGLAEDYRNNRNVAFHEYSKSKFFADFPDLIRFEIYLRNDTINIFNEENKVNE